MAHSDMATLKKEVQTLHVRYPALSIDNVFVLWFMHSYLVEDEKAASESLVGRASDWGLDAIYTDHANKKVFCLQAKYRTGSSAPTEQRSDLRSFANLAHAFHGDEEVLRKLLQKADEKVKDRVTQIVRLLKKSEYALDLFFVTTGRVSKALADEAETIVENAAGPSEIMIFSRNHVLSHLENWLTDAAPGVPSLDLELEPGSGLIKRSDPRNNVESFVFSMRGINVGDLYKRAGVRLFARNIRGFLGGDEDVNRAIRDTLDTCPENFWYYNNGVTLVCDKTRRVDKGTHEILRLYNPQVINGQQTTRTLADFGSKRASVLVRVIAIPRVGDERASKFEELVSRIVQATNWQNEIAASDLCANDFEQVRLQREFRRLGYRAASAFFRMTRGKGETALDVSTFFKKRDLDDRFEAFVESGSNPQRRKARSALKKFRETLLEFEVA